MFVWTGRPPGAGFACGRIGGVCVASFSDVRGKCRRIIHASFDSTNTSIAYNPTVASALVPRFTLPAESRPVRGGDDRKVDQECRALAGSLTTVMYPPLCLTMP